MKLRKHQEEFSIVMDEVIKQRQIGQVIAAVTPGGGKSCLPVIAAEKLIPAGIINKIAWFVPRLSLALQAEEAFTRALKPCPYRILKTDNTANPSRGYDGLTATYQSAVSDNQEFIQDFEKHKYALVLDEWHHADEGGEWHKAMQPLVERAKLVIVMSGNLGRSDGNRVALLNYFEDEKGKKILDLSNTTHRRVINYSRKDALLENAIIDVNFSWQDGKAIWIDKDGKVQNHESISILKGEQVKGAIRTVLSTDYSTSLLDKAVEHWNEYRRHHQRSKLLVVASRIDEARDLSRHLNEAGYHADYAVSKRSKDGADVQDSKKAIKTIGQFKGNSLDILVTVGMAYEGLDVPSITHLVCLTDIRAYPWLEQMIARATRFDREGIAYELQKAHIYVPDDELIRDVVAKIQAEHIEAAKEKADGKGTQPEPEPRLHEFIQPLESETTRLRSGDFNSNLSYEETKHYENLGRAYGVFATPLQIKALLEGNKKCGFTPQAPQEPAQDKPEGPTPTPSMIRDELRSKIESHSRRYDYQNDLKLGDTNKDLSKAFDYKKRHAMTIDELEQALSWLQKNKCINHEEVLA